MTKLVHHKDLTREHWFKFSLMIQLANVGCDIDRAILARNQGDEESSRYAFERAMELLDLTIEDPKNRGPRLRELTRTREALKDYFLCDNEYQTTDQQWHDYFYQFGWAAALEREAQHQQRLAARSMKTS